MNLPHPGLPDRGKAQVKFLKRKKIERLSPVTKEDRWV